LDLMIDASVLVPRQETETVVERVLDLARCHFPLGDLRIADVGTGSGAIAVSLAVHLPRARILATDAFRQALRVAGLNARRHGVEARVSFSSGDLLEAVEGPVEIVVANLPYVPASQWERLQPEIRCFEPREALVPGEGGLEAVLRLLDQVQARKVWPRWTVLEVGDGQAAAVVRQARLRFPDAAVSVFQDLHGLDRGVVIEQAPICPKR
ncbi:MAG: HemK family protein methyltransferase, partial [Dehalococcoidia bacterium]